MRWRFVLACGLAVGLALVVGRRVTMLAAGGGPQVTSSTSAAGGTTSISGMTVPEAPLFGAGVMSGVVTDGTTGLPIEGVLVSLVGGRPGPAGRPQQMTDARGRFVFTHLISYPDYSVSAAKLGYLAGGYRPRIRVMRPAADGGFSTRELLPGKYRIAALTDVEEGEWRTAAFHESVVDSSIAVMVVDGQTTKQDIRIR